MWLQEFPSVMRVRRGEVRQVWVKWSGVRQAEAKGEAARHQHEAPPVRRDPQKSAGRKPKGDENGVRVCS